MKAVLMSIQPKWCELIASGKKTVEVRRTRPKLETPFKCYIYCTKDNTDFVPSKIWWKADKTGFQHILNGKIIGEFVCDKIEHGHILWAKGRIECDDQVEEKAQLTYRQMFDYLGENGVGYFWHISNLVIYDRPKELSEFWSADKCPYASKDGCTYKFHCFRSGQTKRCGSALTRPPQSWSYVEEL